MKLRNAPTRLATGAFILNSGIGKWGGGHDQAAGVHAMAAGAYPVLTNIPPARFLRMLAGAEMVIGTALLAPFLSNRVAGTLLTGFSGGLLGMYLRTPALHEPGSIRPTADGTAISKDAWMLGIGVGLLADPVAPTEDTTTAEQARTP